MKHRKTWMALLLCAALLLSGCAGKQEDAKEETSQKVLNFGCQMYDDGSVNTAMAISSSWNCMRYGISEALFRFDDNMNVEPWLAESYTVSEDGKTGALLELSCETDFVGSNAKFTGFASKVAEVVATTEPADVDALLEKPMGEETVSSELTEMIHIMGENMKIARFAARKAENGALASYIHMGGKIGVLVEFAFEKAETAQAESFKTFAHDVALQVAAVAPICATRDQVPAETVEHEKQIYMAQAAESGKPEAIQEKMAVGRLEKFYKQSVLTEQEFIKDSSLTIKKYAEQVSKELGDTITVVAFDRLVRGE